MSPFDLVGIAKLNGIDLIALTDHNTSRNCPAAAAAAAEYGIGFIPGMEATTSEDIHCVCLFPTLDAAMSFNSEWETHMIKFPNRADIFGNQILIHPDGEISELDWLLISTSDVSIIDLPGLAAKYDGICYPAHIDREANGIFAILGSWPPELTAPIAEIRDTIPPGLPEGFRVVRGSDAHRIEDIPEGGFSLPITTPNFSGLSQYLFPGK